MKMAIRFGCCYYLFVFIVVVVLIEKSKACPWPCVCIPNKSEVRCFGSNITNEHLKGIAGKIPTQKVRHLYIRGGAFDIFPVREFKRNPLLLSLHMDANKLTNIPTNLSSVFPNLRILNIENNQLLKMTSESLQGFSELTIIRMKRNSIKTIESGVFRDTKNLKKLDLSWNNITTFSSNSFTGLEDIHSLNVNHNQIKTLPPELLYNFSSSFLSVNFAYNRIEILPNNLFSSNMELREFDVSYNQINEIADKAFANVTRFGTVFLENNALRDIPASAIKNISSGIFIIFNNPLYCSCDMYTKLSPYFTKKLQFMGTCVWPVQLKDESLASLMVNLTKQEACPICGRLNVTCENDGHCISINRTSFHCNCTQGFEGKFCEIDVVVFTNSTKTTTPTATTTTTPTTTSTTPTTIPKTTTTTTPTKTATITTKATTTASTTPTTIPKTTTTTTKPTTTTTPTTTITTATTTASTINKTHLQQIFDNKNTDETTQRYEYETASKIIWLFLFSIFILLVFTKIVHAVWKMRHKRDIQTTEYLLY